MRIARINERGGASIFAEVRDCLSSSSRDILQSGVARECEGEESVAGIEERRGEKRSERRERREKSRGRTATGDGEIFNSLLIKANFLWLSLPGNPLGGFSSGDGGGGGGGYGGGDSGSGGGGGGNGGSNASTNLRFPIPRCVPPL